MHILYPHEVRQEAERAPLELDADLERRDTWMFAPLIAIVVALPILITAVLGFTVMQIRSETAMSSETPATVIASRWPEQSLPIVDNANRS
jgi:hypothetical protein